MLKIKVGNKEHSSACSDGCAYGLVNGRNGMYAYAELGTEEDYVPGENEDLREDRRLFGGCEVFFATTPENLKEGVFEDKTYKGPVIIFK